MGFKFRFEINYLLKKFIVLKILVFYFDKEIVYRIIFDYIVYFGEYYVIII